MEFGDPFTFACGRTLALSLYEQKEDYERAEILYRLMLEESKKVLGQEDPRTVSLIKEFVLTLSGQCKWVALEATRRWLLEVDEKMLGKTHQETLRSLSRLALALRVQGKYSEAEVHLGLLLERQEETLL
jgi:hypothetical protein